MYSEATALSPADDNRLLTGRIPWLMLVCGLTGITTPFTLRLAGNFPVAEGILLLAAAGALVVRLLHHRWPDGAANTRWFGALAFLQLVGLAAYILSDLYRGSTPQDYLRGWARMAFVAIDLVGLACLVGTSWRRLMVFIGGFAIGQAASAVAFGPLFGDWWKFGFATPVTYLAFLALGRSGRWSVSLVAVALGLVHIALEFRSLGLECLMVAVAIHLVRVPRIWQLLAVIAGCITVALVMGGLFDSHSDSRTKLGRHSSDDERRAMMEVATEAFAESPLIGQGSWFSVTKIHRRIETRYIQLSDSFNGYTEEQERELSVHSQLLTALAEGGLFGAGFFFAYAALLLCTLAYALRTERLCKAMVLMLLIEALWNLAITPFSGPARVQIAASAVMGLMLWQQARDRLYWEGGRE